MFFSFKSIGKSFMISFKFYSDNLDCKLHKQVPMSCHTNTLYTSHVYHNRMPLFKPFSEIYFDIDSEILVFVFSLWFLPNKEGIISPARYFSWKWIPRFLRISLVSLVKPLDQPCLFLDSDVKVWRILSSA